MTPWGGGAEGAGGAWLTPWGGGAEGAGGTWMARAKLAPASLLSSAHLSTAGPAAENPDRRRRTVLLLPAPNGLAATLVLVEIAVGRLIHRLPVLSLTPGGDADADLDLPRRPQAQPGLVDRAPQPRRHIACAVEVGLGHGDRKLVSAHAGAEVRGPHHALQLLRDKAQRPITGAVPEPVVDALQVVEVDHHQGQPPVVPLGQRDLAFHDPFELATVGETGHVVGSRLARELARPIEGDRHLVRDRGHEQEVRGTEDPVGHRAHAHHAHGPTSHPDLGAQSVPLAA